MYFVKPTTMIYILFLFWFRTAGWRSLLAGLIAGPSMLLTGPKTQHTSLAIYILMRATVLASRCGIKSQRFGGVCKPLTWSHGDVFLMCLASSQILYVHSYGMHSFSFIYNILVWVDSYA